MPIILILVLAIIIAQIGFWKTLGSILGAIAMVVILVVLAVVAVGVLGAMLFRRGKG
jgi:membrane protein YdbS with pleckstrin-like domain